MLWKEFENKVIFIYIWICKLGGDKIKKYKCPLKKKRKKEGNLNTISESFNKTEMWLILLSWKIGQINFR